jgi:hypothetical protein
MIDDIARDAAVAAVVLMMGKVRVDEEHADSLRAFLLDAIEGAVIAAIRIDRRERLKPGKN